MKALADFAAFMNAGGAVNWIIAALYLAVLGVSSFRAAYFWHTGRGKKSAEEIGRSMAERAPHQDCAGTPGQVERIAYCFWEHIDKPKAALDETLEREGAIIAREMEKGAAFLGFSCAVAPLLGLLGTITGLMSAFSKIEALGGNVDIASLSGGIREAMITTATGLVTAISAAAFLKIFEALADKRLHEMALAVSWLEEQRGAA